MKYGKSFFKCLPFLFIIALASCDKSSSPEGRMGMKLEDLQQQMLDSMQQHNRALLDSISQIRRELTALKENK